MFSSPIIDLVILLSFTYFIGGLLLTAMNEGISQGMFRLRQKGLQHAIENLFFNDPTWLPYVKTTFMNSPHIIALLRKSGSYPAYIPSNNFVLAIIEGIGAGSYSADKLSKGITDSTLLPAELKKVLLDIAARSGNNTAAFEKHLTQFYDDAMDRAGGWYKKRIRKILLAVGLIISIALNIDTIKITNDALSNTDKLSQTVDKIVSELPEIKRSGKDNIIITDSKDSIRIQQSASLGIPADSTGKTTEQTISDLKNIRIFYENNSGMMLGYNGDFFEQWGFSSSGKGNGLIIFLKKLLGIIITAFALQLGSNYWFDILNKVGNIRGVGKKPNGK